jgi:F420-dependent oxidoreductase-like protein
MKVGLMVPQGWKHEYDGWDTAAAWARSLELTRRAEALGFESLWVFDHFHTVEPDATDDPTWESFSTLAALAMVTSRVRLGHMVVCTTFRNPGLTAKLSSTLDMISNGRFELGIGAGWKEDEWLAYGYGFPPVAERLAVLSDHLEVITRMLGPGRATYHGQYAHVDGAVNEPKGIQRHIPIIVGGNGRQKTASLAVKHADELNLVYIRPPEVRELIAAVRERCERAGRDPDTLKISLYTADDDFKEPGQARIDRLAEYRALPMSRIVLHPLRWDPTIEALERFAGECVAAGFELDA